MVVCGLPKAKTRVRFPYPAHMKLFKLFAFIVLGAVFAFVAAVWLGWPFQVDSTALPNWKGIWSNMAVWFSTYGVWVVVARQLYRTVKRMVIIASVLLFGGLIAVGYFFQGFDRLSLLFGQ